MEKLRDANHKNTVLKELDAARLQVRVFLFTLGHTMLDKSWSRIVNQRVQKSVLRNMYTILLMKSKHSLYLKSTTFLQFYYEQFYYENRLRANWTSLKQL